MINVTPNVQLLLGVVLGIYLTGLLVLSLIARKKVQDEEDYLVAGRRLPLYLAFGTLIATWFGAATMMGSAEAAQEGGLTGDVTLDPFACSATLVLAGLFFAKRLWSMKLFTMADFYRRTYGVKTEIVGACVQVVGYFGWIAAQYVALAGILQAYFGLDPKYGILIAAGVTLFYTMIGGMWSVTLTDTAQIAVAFLGLIVLAAVTYSHMGGGSILAGLDRLLQETPDERLRLIPPASAGAVVFLGWGGQWITGLFGNIPGQDLQQRVFAAKDARTASQACILAGIVYFCFGMIPVSLGLASNIVANPEDIQGGLLPTLAKSFLSPPMAVIFTLALVSIIVSTATSAVLAPATILGHNLVGRLRFAHGRHLLVDRLCVLLCGMGGVALAYRGERILGLLEISLDMALVGLFVPLLFGLFGKPRGELPGLLAIVLGTSVWLGRYLFENAFMPVPENLEIEYIDYIARRFSPERVGEFWSGVTYYFALVPAGLWGLAASFLAYFLGQGILARRGIRWTPRAGGPDTHA